MESIQTRKKGPYIGQKEVLRFRASSDLHQRLKSVALDEELCLAALIRKLVVDALEKFPK